MPINAPETYNTTESDADQPAASSFPVLDRALSIRGSNSPASLALKQRSLDDREHIAAQNFDLKSQQEEYNKIALLSHIETEKLRVRDSMELQRQTMQATKSLAELDHDSPDYQRSVLKIMADNPLASTNPMIGKAVQFGDQYIQRKQIMSDALRLHGQTEAAEYAGRYGVPVQMMADGFTPDFAGMSATQKKNFETQAGNAGAGIVAPGGLETGNIKVTDKGDRSVEFVRPAKSLDTLKRFTNETKELGLSFDDFENPGKWKQVPDNPAKIYNTFKDAKGNDQTITVDADHFKRLQQDYAHLTTEPAATVGAAPADTGSQPTRLKFNPQTGNLE